MYVSIDIDCLDPAFAPGISHHEPGGMSTREVINISHGLKGNIVGADIVEYNPDRDFMSMTSMVAAKLLKEGEADALVSAGPTGAVVASAIRHVGMIDGIERPVIGGAIFDALPGTVVFDCGVNMDCKPYHMLTFALIGSVYCRKLLNIANPTVGLLNIGAEAEKGNQLTKETYRILEESGLNFIGNVEGNQIMNGRTNVLVCDAFVGNVLFKFVESIGMFHDTAGRENGADLGGGIIWGVNGLVRKLHGASQAPHVALKIHHARLAVEADLVDTLKSDLTGIAGGIKP